MSFPKCATNSVMHVQILRQPPGNAAPIPVAKKAIKIDKLPWNSEGQASNRCTAQFTCFTGTKVQILTLRCAALQVPALQVNLEDLTDVSASGACPHGAVEKAKQVRSGVV